MCFVSHTPLWCYIMVLLLAQCQGYGGGSRKTSRIRYVGGGSLGASEDVHFVDSTIQAAVLAASNLVHADGQSPTGKGASYVVAPDAPPIRLEDVVYYWSEDMANSVGNNCMKIARNDSQAAKCESLGRRPLCSNEIFKRRESPDIRLPNGNRVAFLFWRCPAGLSCSHWECCREEAESSAIAGFIFFGAVFFLFCLCSTVCRKAKEQNAAREETRWRPRDVFERPVANANEIVSIAHSTEPSSPAETPPPSYTTVVVFPKRTSPTSNESLSPTPCAEGSTTEQAPPPSYRTVAGLE